MGKLADRTPHCPIRSGTEIYMDKELLMKKHRKCDTAKYRKQRQKHIREKRKRNEERLEATRADNKTQQDRELMERLLGVGSFGGVR